MESVPGLLVTLAMIPVIGLAVVYVVREMVMTNIGGPEGVLAIGILLALFVVSIVSRTPIVAGATIVGLLALAAFYPYAEAQLSRQIGRELNVGRIEKAHEALAQRPDNVAAWFALAQGLYAHGYQGHAVAVAEGILARLSDASQDGVGGTSMKDIFRAEASALRQWKKDLDPLLARPLRCPLCGASNPPGPIACVKCGKPYLLELVRNQDHRRKFVGKLVLGWSLLALTICGAAFAGTSLKGYWQGLALGGMLAAVGLILWWLFKPSRGDRTSGWEI